MSTPEKPAMSLADIAKVKDPALRAATAVTYRFYALARAKEALDLRDAALRELKAAGVSISQIAERTGVNVATVKAVVR